MNDGSKQKAKATFVYAGVFVSSLHFSCVLDYGCVAGSDTAVRNSSRRHIGTTIRC